MKKIRQLSKSHPCMPLVRSKGNYRLFGGMRFEQPVGMLQLPASKVEKMSVGHCFVATEIHRDSRRCQDYKGPWDDAASVNWSCFVFVEYARDVMRS